MKTFRLQFITSHLQFYISDKNSPFVSDSNHFWTDEASSAKLALEEGLLGIGIFSYDNANIELRLLDAAPVIDLSASDHVVEGSVALPSGVLCISSCDDAVTYLETEVIPGIHRARISSKNLDSIKDEYESSDDFYLVEMWPENAARNRSVLKAYVQ